MPHWRHNLPSILSLYPFPLFFPLSLQYLCPPLSHSLLFPLSFIPLSLATPLAQLTLFLHRNTCTDSSTKTPNMPFVSRLIPRPRWASQY